MEVTTLFFRLLMLELILLGTQVQDSYAQKSDAAFLRITPNRLQHFPYDSVSFDCEGFDDSTQLRVMKNAQESDPECEIKKTSTGSVCTNERVYPGDSGEYWCETKGGKRSNSVNITVTDGSVILESPVLPVLEGDNVTLRCRNKTTSHVQAYYYKDGVIIWKYSTGEMTIADVSKSDEGLYKCYISGVGASPESWLAVRADPLILESPVLPVMEGNNVTLRCRKKIIFSNLKADFYKDGLLIRNSSTGEMIIHSVSKSDEGLYKCSISGSGESAESWLSVKAGPSILESPVLPVMEGNNVTLRCRKKTTFSNLTADFYKDGLLVRSSSTGEMIIHSVSKSDEGLYKCSISGSGESAESWLAVRAPHRETCPCSDHFFYVLLLVRTVSTIVMVALLLLLVGLLHCGKLTVTPK